MIWVGMIGLSEEHFWRPSFIFRFKELSANHLTSATICKELCWLSALSNDVPLVMDGSNRGQDHLSIYIKQDII